MAVETSRWIETEVGLGRRRTEETDPHGGESAEEEGKERAGRARESEGGRERDGSGRETDERRERARDRERERGGREDERETGGGAGAANAAGGRRRETEERLGPSTKKKEPARAFLQRERIRRRHGDECNDHRATKRRTREGTRGDQGRNGPRQRDRESPFHFPTTGMRIKFEDWALPAN